MTQDTKQYEFSYILAPSIPADEVDSKLAAIRAMIEKHEGAFLGEEAPRLKPIAYEIRKSVANKIVRYTQGYMGSLYFSAPSIALPEITAALTGNDLVVRYLVVEFQEMKEQAVRESQQGEEVAEAPAVETLATATSEDANQKIDAEIDSLIAANS